MKPRALNAATASKDKKAPAPTAVGYDLASRIEMPQGSSRSIPLADTKHAPMLPLTMRPTRVIVVHDQVVSMTAVAFQVGVVEREVFVRVLDIDWVTCWPNSNCDHRGEAG